MTRRTLAWVATAVAGVVLVTAMAFAAFWKGEISLTTEQMQSAFDRALPKSVAGAAITRAEVDLSDGRIAVRFHAEGEQVQRRFSATGIARGGLRFDAARGYLYFQPDLIAIDSFTIEEGTLAVSRLRGFVDRLVAGAARNVFAVLPVYRLHSGTVGMVIAASVSDIRLDGDRVVLTLSLWQLTTSTLLGLLGLLVLAGFVVALLRNPEALLASCAAP
jgi:hypothetical protein